MPTSNKYSYITATSDNLLPIMQAVSDIVGIPLDDDGVMWLNAERTFGIGVKPNPSSSIAVYLYVKCFGSDYSISNFDLNGAYLAYNYSKEKNVFAFGSGDSSFQINLSWAIVKDTSEIVRVIVPQSASEVKIYTPEFPSFTKYKIGITTSANFTGVTLARVPALFTPEPYPELYQVLAACDTNWGFNGTIYADKTCYKLIVYDDSEYGALAFPVNDD